MWWATSYAIGYFACLMVYKFLYDNLEENPEWVLEEDDMTMDDTRTMIDKRKYLTAIAWPFILCFAIYMIIKKAVG